MSGEQSDPPLPAPLSINALQQRKTQHRASWEQLKLKQSDSAIEQGSVKYLRLKIEEARLERDEIEIEADEAHIAMCDNLIDKKTFLKSRKASGERLLSQGGYIWKLQQQLRDREEQDDKDPLKSTKISRTMQSDMRRAAIAAYGSRPPENENEYSKCLRCAVTHEYYPAMFVKTAHIVPTSVGVNIADYLFGNGAGPRLLEPDNCLMLCGDIKMAMDVGSITFVPSDATEKPIRRWKVVVIHKAAADRRLLCRAIKNLGDLDGRELEFRTEHRPATEFFYFHFLMTLLKAREDDHPGWSDAWLRLKTERLWPTRCRYLRHSMLLCLVRTLDDLDEKEVNNIASDFTFQDGEHLASDDKNEIVRPSLEPQETPDDENWPEEVSEVNRDDENRCEDQEYIFI